MLPACATGAHAVHQLMTQEAVLLLTELLLLAPVTGVAPAVAPATCAMRQGMQGKRAYR